MTDTKKMSAGNLESRETVHIHIAGELKLQNELFADALANCMGLPCDCTSRDRLPYLIEANNRGNSLVLWDCVDEDQETVWDSINYEPPHTEYQFALFNVKPEHKIEAQAIKRGIRGIFYRKDSLPTYKKGIQAILDGHLWVSRHILEKCLTESETSSEAMAEKHVFLTFREQEILARIAAGLSKDDIADGLSISPHTVKTHTHNIYQKINVKSRIKAAIWATQHLRHPMKPSRNTRNADMN